MGKEIRKINGEHELTAFPKYLHYDNTTIYINPVRGVDSDTVLYQKPKEVRPVLHPKKKK